MRTCGQAPKIGSAERLGRYTNFEGVEGEVGNGEACAWQSVSIYIDDDTSSKHDINKEVGMPRIEGLQVAAKAAQSDYR